MIVDWSLQRQFFLLSLARKRAMEVNQLRAIVAILPQVLNMIAVASQMLGAASAVPRYLQVMSTLLTQAEPAFDQLVQLKGLVESMVVQNREPTDDEWSALKLRSDIAHQGIQDYDPDAPTAA